MSIKPSDTIFIFAKHYFTQIGLMSTLEKWFPEQTVILANDFDLKTIGATTSSNSNLLIFIHEDFTGLEESYPGFDNLDSTIFSTIILASNPNQEDLAAAVVAGVSGYFSDESDEKELKDGFHSVMKGQNYYTRTSIESVFISPHSSTIRMAKRKVKDLTRRQKEVLDLIGQGFSNANIATELDLSPNTVRIHISAIFKTLDVSNRTQAAILVH
jgi:DNA-binding NarL/FixJ family response regulator